MNVKLIIAFDGKDFLGWQEQKNETEVFSIQSILEKALAKIYKTEINVFGSSRTDRGVNAKGFCANFFSPFFIPPKNLKKAINSNLASFTKNIKIVEAEYVDDNFSSRFSAKSKVYIYRLTFYPEETQIFDKFCQFLNKKLDTNDIFSMKKDSKIFLGKHDFRAFSLFDKIEFQDKNTICEIFYIDVKKFGNKIYVIVKGDRFLHKMVRFIVGSILQVGEKNLTIEQIKENLESGKRKHQMKIAKPEGLFLKTVSYKDKSIF